MMLSLKLWFFLPPWHQLSSRVCFKEGVDMGLDLRVRMEVWGFPSSRGGGKLDQDGQLPRVCAA